MDALKNKIVLLLTENSQDINMLHRELLKLEKTDGEEIYQKLLEIFLNKFFHSPSDAKRHWLGIVAHAEALRDELGRTVSAATAAADYFTFSHDGFKNPKLIELYDYEQMTRHTYQDSLTHLYNRRYFDHALDSEIHRAQRYGLEFSLLFIDLDKFKLINDTYGHSAGDLVLKTVSETILNLKRQEDLAARYGGEELVLILPQTSKEQSHSVAERLREKIEKTTLSHEDNSLKVTMSGGIAHYPSDARKSHELIQLADEAVYRAKKNGRNQIVMYSIESAS